jgi:Ku protein
MRPYWKGYLKLALVSCPIALHAACSTAERIAFRQINKATGNRVRQQLIDEETREPLNPEHKVRGYELAKGQYLIVEDDELEAIEIDAGALDASKKICRACRRSSDVFVHRRAGRPPTCDGESSR